MAYRKKLIEVALPLVAINAASAREKSIRHGHPSTLHLWWARRPLAACRAVLFASLVNDPDDDPMYGVNEEIAGNERAKLFNLIEELVKWENSNNPDVINRARAEIARSIAANKVADGEWRNEQAVVQVEVERKAKSAEGGAIGATAHDFKHKLARPEQVNAFLAEHAPPVLDPFCGGGSIPLEAQRLGLRAYASDLNPVAVLINKALIEIPPKFAGRPPRNPTWQGKSAQEKAAAAWHGAVGLAADVRYYGQWMRAEAEKRIGHLYPKVAITAEMAKERPDLEEYIGKELIVIAWIWARTIGCPNPACGAKTPIAKTFKLSAKPGNEAHADPVVLPRTREVHFHVRRGTEARTGNVNRRGAECLVCGTPIPLEHIRDEAVAGRMDQTMMAIVAEGRRNRVYLTPTEDHVSAAAATIAVDAWSPTTNLPEQALGFRVQRYGMTSHAALFSKRQLVALSTFADLVREVVDSDGSLAGEYAAAVGTYLAFAVSKAANYWSSLCSWYVKLEKMVSTFGLPTLSMVWDFTEANPFSDSSGNWMLGVEQAASAIENLFPNVVKGSVTQLDAIQYSMTEDAMPLVSTDPPYYDNIGYANLSDFFYIWLRRCVAKAYPTLFSTVLTPKDAELIAEPGRFGNNRERAIDHFERGSTTTFTRLRSGADADLPMTVFYAFKQQESDQATNGDDQTVVSSGWEKMLASLISSGCSIQGTWPIRTEQAGGLREAKRNALSSSIVLVCRPRRADAPLATRKEFITALGRELPEALRNLQRGNIAPVDLAQAAIGPGMAVFTRYAKVLESDGTPMSVRTALGLINQALDEVLAEQEGEFDGDTRWALAWFEQFGMQEGPFGEADVLARAKDTAINRLVNAGVVHARAGKVRLVRREELDGDWDPTARILANPATRRLTVWEVTQHLIRTLDTQGESGAAALLHKLGGVAETARDLAYRLYNLCERKKWAEEALAYNGLVIAWPELSKLALAERNRPAERQQELI